MIIKDKDLKYYDDDLKSCQDVLEDRKLSGTSNIVSEYENSLSNFFESKFAISTSSGTAAIQVALFTADIKKGDEVVLAPTCPIMTLLPILEIGAVPIFCDTEKNSFNLDIFELNKILSSNSKIKAVIDVPMWGYPTNIDKLFEIVKVKFDLFLIADLAQAHGSKINQKYLNSFTDISCFSTHDKKILSTGEGGFILLNDKALREKAKSFRQFGNMDGVSFGLNFKLGALQSSIGVNRIKYINDEISARTKNAQYICKEIKNKNVTPFDIPVNGKANFYALVLNLKFSNNLTFIEYLEENGIPSDITRYNYKVAYKYPLFSSFSSTCENAENLVNSITTIPVHSNLSEKELDYIVSIINKYKE